VEPLPDLGALSDADLRRMIRDLQAQEHVESFDRKMLHGKIAILRAALVARLEGEAPEPREP
jgi:hypothetical protein